MAKLKQCPFCGEVPKAEWHTDSYMPHLIVRHKAPTECALEMSVHIFAEDEAAAIQKWNRRVEHG